MQTAVTKPLNRRLKWRQHTPPIRHKNTSVGTRYLMSEFNPKKRQ